MSTRVLAAAALAVILVGCAQGGSTTTPTGSSLAAASPSIAVEATPLPSPTPNADPTPRPTPTPRPWQTYTSAEFDYTITYPPQWFVIPATPDTSDLFHNGGSTAVFVWNDVVDGDSKASVTNTLETEVEFYEGEYRARLLSNDAVTVAGWDGRLITFSGVDSGLSTYFQLVLIAKDRVGYFIEWRSFDNDHETDSALFRTIYETFEPGGGTPPARPGLIGSWRPRQDSNLRPSA